MNPSWEQQERQHEEIKEVQVHVEIRLHSPREENHGKAERHEEIMSEQNYYEFMAHWQTT